MGNLEVSDWIALGGVLVTGVFSFLVWRATLKTVEVSKSMLKLNERVTIIEEKRDKEYRNNMRMLWIPRILADSEIVYNALANDNVKGLFNNLRKISDLDLEINMNDLATYFNKDEVEIISNAWESYHAYKEKYLREGYNDNGMITLFEKAPGVSDKFYLLIEKMKKVE